MGPLDVVDQHGAALELGGARQRQVLALLLVRRGGVVTADAVIDELWGDAATPTALTSVQVAVSKLRKHIGATRIETRPGGYRLQVDEQDVDAARFERLLAEGRFALHGADAGSAVALLRRGLAEWRGDVLTGTPGGPILTAAADRLHQLRVETWQELMRAELERGHHHEVLAELHDLVRLHPFHERFHAQLMLALYRSGRQAEALSAYTRARDLLLGELGVDPSQELVDLERRILRQDDALAGPRSSRPQRVRDAPASSTRLVGRHGELTELEEILHAGARLITLTGPGGVGKTRLLAAFAHRCAADDRGGEPLWIDLSALSVPDLVVSAVADALRVTERGDRPLTEAVIDTLNRHPTTLLLDNFEHVLPAADLVAAMLTRVPTLRVLVTSRERLSLYGEYEYVVDPLRPPAADEATLEAAADSAAVELFVDRARAAQHRFALSAENVAAVGDLCRRLDGLPLALELAAARLKLFSVAELTERLDRDHRAVLSGGVRDRPERHRTLHDTIAWSYQGLSDVERTVLQACAVFAGGAAIDALETTFGYLDAGGIVDHLSSLLDKSLLTRADPASAPVRVGMLETVRSFAAGELRRSAYDDDFRRRHAQHVARLAEAAYVGLWGDQHDYWLRALDVEMNNVRAALEWLTDQGEHELGARICAHLGPVWWFRGSFGEGIGWLTRTMTGVAADTELHRRALVWLISLRYIRNKVDTDVGALEPLIPALAADGSHVEQSEALRILSDKAYLVGEYDRSIALAEQAVAEARLVGAAGLVSRALIDVAITVAEVRDYHEGMAIAATAQSMVPPGATRWRLFNEVNLGWLEITNHAYAEARDRLAGCVEDVEVHVEGDMRYSLLCAIHTNLGWAVLGCDQPEESTREFCAAIRLGLTIDDQYAMTDALVGLGCAAQQRGALELAALCFGAADTLVSTTNLPLPAHSVERQEAALQSLGSVTLLNLRAQGRGTPIGQVLARAMSVTSPTAG